MKKNNPKSKHVSAKKSTGAKLAGTDDNAGKKAAVAEPEMSDAAKAKLKAKGVEQLIALGKEKGFLTYDDLNKALPAHVTSGDEIEDVLATLNNNQIEVQEAEEPVAVGVDRFDLDLVPRFPHTDLGQTQGFFGVASAGRLNRADLQVGLIPGQRNQPSDNNNF